MKTLRERGGYIYRERERKRKESHTLAGIEEDDGDVEGGGPCDREGMSKKTKKGREG